MNTRTIVQALALLLATAAGCGPPPTNRSPTPEEAPERHARAREEDLRAMREAKDAEARFFRARGLAPPDDESLAAAPDRDDPSRSAIDARTRMRNLP